MIIVIQQSFPSTNLFLKMGCNTYHLELYFVFVNLPKRANSSETFTRELNHTFHLEKFEDLKNQKLVKAFKLQ